MSPGLILVLLSAMLLAMLPVWRLRKAGWRPGVLFWAWVVYAVALFAMVRAPALTRFLLPVLVLAFVAPFVAGPERLSKALGPKAPQPRPIIDVTPKRAPGLAEPPRNVTPDDDEPDADEPDGGAS